VNGQIFPAEMARCIHGLSGLNVLMTTNTASASGLNRQDAKYRAGIDECLREIKEIQKVARRSQAKIERLRGSSRRIMNDAWDVLRRVEATL
jgi:hypothetical protein